MSFAKQNTMREVESEHTEDFKFNERAKTFIES